MYSPDSPLKSDSILNTNSDSPAMTPVRGDLRTTLLKANSMSGGNRAEIKNNASKKGYLTLKCESLEVDTDHIRGLRSKITKTKSFTYGFGTGPGSDSDLSQSSAHHQPSIQAFPHMDYMRQTLGFHYVASPLPVAVSALTRDSFDSNKVQMYRDVKNVCEIGDKHLAQLHSACATEYNAQLAVYGALGELNSPSGTHTVNKVESNDSAQLHGIPSFTSNSGDDVVNDPLKALHHFLDVAVVYSEVLQLQDKYNEALSLILSVFNQSHTLLPAIYPLYNTVCIGTNAMSPNSIPNNPTPNNNTTETIDMITIEFDWSVIRDMDALLQRLVRSPTQFSVEKCCRSLSPSCLHSLAMVLRRLGVLLRVQEKYQDSLTCLQTVVHMMKVLSEYCDDYLTDLASSYALLAAVLNEMGSAEESLQIDRKGLELSSILIAT